MTRHVIVIIDGTNCSAARGAEDDFTNAFAMFYGTQQVDPFNSRPNTVILYHPGPANRNVFGKLRNEITGAELEDMVREAYLSLCLNVHDIKNDKIYVFGYSRGAIIAKALAEMVSQSGLLLKKDFHLIDNAYKFYRTNKAEHELCLLGKTYDVKISFVGLFDPVQGPKNRKMTLALQKKICENIKYAVEIFAINEKRITFRPHIWQLEQPKDSYLDATIAEAPPPPHSLNLQQIWIPGTHGDIADPSSNSIFTDIAFLTMIERVASKCDLPINLDYINMICQRLIARKANIKISQKFHVLPYVRKIPLTATAAIHSICSKVDGRSVYYNKKIKRYKISSKKNPRALESLRVYGFDIASIDRSGLGQAREKILAAIEITLTQIQSKAR